MASFKPVTLSKASFAFCRTTVAILLWLAVIFQNSLLIGVTLIIMLFSAILKVERAPLILLWKHTIEKMIPSKPEVVDERGIFVSHIVATVFSILCIGLIYLAPFAGWIMTVAFAILQTSAAFGFCSALKLYNCMISGNCCRFGRATKKVRDHVRHP